MKIVQVFSPEQIPSAIQGEMLMLGKPQVLLARELGFTEKHISQMLTGKAGISLPNLYKILAYLDLALLVVPNTAPEPPC